MMLAELTGLEIGSIITGFVFGAIGLLIAGVSAFRKQDVKLDQPVNITITEELHKVFAGKDVFDKHVAENSARHAELFSRIGAAAGGAENKISAEVTQIHARINLLDKSNSRLEATTELQNEKLNIMDDKLDGMPERIIATLKNTGAI
jgi:hypothetical protein